MKRALALLAPAVLVLGLVACGDDDDSPDTTTATEATETQTGDTTDVTAATPSSDAGDTDADGSVTDSQRDLMAQIFPNLDGDQIDCLVGELGDSADAMDPARAQAAAEACDIDPADLVPDMSAISIPDDISVPDNMDEIMAQVFPNLDEDQISCLVDEVGADFDPSKAAQLAETCNIDPADLAPG
jgi:hypothetical protein